MASSYPDITFWGRKLVRLILVVITVSAITFLMVDLLPGDVAYSIVGFDANQESIDAIREELGLNYNVAIRFFNWFTGLLQGDFGISYRTREPVWDAVLTRLPVTLELLFFAQIFALLLALPLGILSAAKAGGTLDRVLGSTAFGLLSIPHFVMALLLIFIFALRLQWLPATGYTPLSAGLWANVRGFLLPGLCIALVEWVPLMRVLRSDMITTLQQDYILMARAKGLPTWWILLKHALRPSSLTLITLLGLQIGHLIGGAVVTEIIFALPGLGRLLVEAIFARDAQVVQGCILIVTVGYVFTNFTVDVLYSVLDPRIRLEKRYG